MSALQLLSDEQVRRFVVDGFVVLDSGVDRGTHREIESDLAFSGQYEFPMGDNLLARFPLVHRVIDSPVVRGAMVSLLGPDFAWSPHRAIHNSEPLEGSVDDFDVFANSPKMGKGSLSGSGWHQDGHSKAGRVRWPECRAVNVFYFPQDTPADMGPTRVLAGSHLYATLRDVDRRQAMLAGNPVKAGTVLIAHFDLGHAGTPNFTDRCRYMLKLVGLRQSNPVEATWDHREPAWSLPPGVVTPDRIPTAWVSLFNWLRGVPRTNGLADGVNDDGTRSDDELLHGLQSERPAAVEAAQLLSARAVARQDGIERQDVIEALVEAMKTPYQDQRLSCMYALAAFGPPAVPALVQSLLSSAGLGRHVSPDAKDPAFYGWHEDPLARYFSNRQLVVEDEAHALVGIGRGALAALTPLLDHDDPWIRMNALYAVGGAAAAPADEHDEAGSPDIGGLADRIGDALDSPDHAVVRTACDALCTLPSFGESTVRRLHRLLSESFAALEVVVMGTDWTAQHQVRVVATLALLARVNAGDPPAGVEEALVAALDDETGYVPAVAAEALLRLGSASGLAAAVERLQRARYDHTHHAAMRQFREHLQSRS